MITGVGVDWWETLDRYYWEEGGIETILADYLPNDAYDNESLMNLVPPLPVRLSEYVKTRNPILKEYLILVLSLIPPWYEDEYGDSLKVLRRLASV
jgi:hypothetical protein